MIDKPDSLADMLLGKAPAKLPPVIADRSKMEQTANCPQQAFLYEKHSIAPPELKINVGDNKLVLVGTLIHDLIHEAIEYCKKVGFDHLPSFFLSELPGTRADVQPEAARAAKFVCDSLLKMPIDRLIGSEIQIDHIFVPAKAMPGDIGDFVITACLDVLMSGNDNSLIVYDWKTGWKKRSSQEAYDSFQTQFIAYILWQQPEYKDVDKIHFFYKETRHSEDAYALLERKKFIHHTMRDLTTELLFQARIFTTFKLMMSGNKDAYPEEKKCEHCDAIWYCKWANANARIIKEHKQEAIDHRIVCKELVKRYDDGFEELIKSGEMDSIEGTTMVCDKKPPANRFTLRWRKREDVEKEMKPTKTAKPAVGKTKQAKKPETKPKPKLKGEEKC